MPMFRVKDLMIQIRSEAEPPGPACGWPAGYTDWGCDVCTVTGPWYCGACTCTCSECTNNHCTYHPTSRVRGFEGGLAELKEALQQQLAAVEAQEKTLGLRSIEEAEMLTAKLEEALEEVRQAKGRLGEGRGG